MTRPRVTDGTDKTLAYRDFHRTLDPHTLVTDIDQLEYRFIDGRCEPVAIIELTSVPAGLTESTEAIYLDRIITRYEGAQGRAIKVAAERIGVPAFHVAFRTDLSMFFVRRIGVFGPWRVMSKMLYSGWLSELRKQPDPLAA